MKKNIVIIALLSVVLCLFAQKTALTPELVIQGGYLKHEQEILFPDKLEKEVESSLSKDDLLKELITFIALADYRIVLDKGDRIVFEVGNVAVGRDVISTPVGGFARSQSEISFKVVVDVKDNKYKYSILDFFTNRRLLNLNTKCIMLAPQEDLKALDLVGASITGYVVLTKGNPNTVQHNRIYSLIAERNGYVNLVIDEKKELSNLQTRYVDKIRNMDSRIDKEIDLYSLEYQTIQNFVKNLENSLK